MPTITDGTTTITPTLVTSYESTRDSANLRHQLVGGSIRMSLRGAGLRTGTLELVFTDEDASAAAEALHRLPSVFTLAYPGRATVGMSYVLAEGGNVTRTLDSTVWLVSVDFQEVEA